MPGSPKEARKYIPYAADQGLPHLVGAASAGVSLQMRKIVLAGAAPHSVVLEDEGFLPMADENYAVLIGGENEVVAVDESTITAEGFDLLGGVAADVVHLVIVGALRGQAV